MVAPSLPVSEAEKREALDVALHSGLFSRSPQLRSFLKYICEMEIAGRASEVTEYQIAVDVLARPKDVSLSEDSSVRNRAYELRQRLEKLYAEEAAEAAVRIEVPRGGYVPTWLRQSRHVQPAAVSGARVARRPLWLAIAGTAVLSLLIGVAVGMYAARPRPPDVLAEAWGPLAVAQNDMLICIATNLHMLVRPHISPRPLLMPAPEGLYPLFRTTRPLEPGTALYMEPAQLSIPLGELTATATLARTRASFGGFYEILPESEAPVPALLGRNIVLFGTPINSNAATFILSQEPLTIGLHGETEFAVIDQRKPPGTNELFVPQYRGSSPSTVYGLLTVISRRDPAGRLKQIVSVTGTGPAACIQAAVEFFCSAEHMRALKRQFAGEGIDGFPSNYQVVIRCQTQGVRLTSYEYVMHVVADKSRMATDERR